MDVSTFAWGAAIGVAALAGWLAAHRCIRHANLVGWLALPLAFSASYAAYELVLYGMTWILPSGPGAFTAAVILRIFALNGAALGLLITAQRLARRALVRVQALPASLSS